MLVDSDRSTRSSCVAALAPAESCENRMLFLRMSSRAETKLCRDSYLGESWRRQKPLPVFVVEPTILVFGISTEGAAAVIMPGGRGGGGRSSISLGSV